MQRRFYRAINFQINFTANFDHFKIGLANLSGKIGDKKDSISDVLIAFNFLVVVIVQWMCTHTERSFHFREKIPQNDAKNNLICENTVA